MATPKPRDGYKCNHCKRRNRAGRMINEKFVCYICKPKVKSKPVPERILKRDEEYNLYLIRHKLGV